MSKVRKKNRRLGTEVSQIRRGLSRVKSPRLTKAILLGSRARGEALESSDYDLLLVSPEFEGMDFHTRIVRMTEQLSGIFLPLDILCYSPSELPRKAKDIGTVRQALKEGIVLFERQ
jgi:predicted nucleotidyltransferase